MRLSGAGREANQRTSSYDSCSSSMFRAPKLLVVISSSTRRSPLSLPPASPSIRCAQTGSQCAPALRFPRGLRYGIISMYLSKAQRYLDTFRACRHNTYSSRSSYRLVQIALMATTFQSCQHGRALCFGEHPASQPAKTAHP